MVASLGLYLYHLSVNCFQITFMYTYVYGSFCCICAYCLVSFYTFPSTYQSSNLGTFYFIFFSCPFTHDYLIYFLSQGEITPYY